MSFLESVFGRNKKPTAATAASELARHEAELRNAPARIARAEAVLLRLADLSDDEHEAAIEELAKAERARDRLADRVEQLRASFTEAEEAEAVAAFKARVDAANTALVIEYPRLARCYEAKARELADAAAALKAIDDEVEAVNRAISAKRKADPGGAHPSIVRTSTERFRSEAGVVEPDRVETEARWMARNAAGRLEGVSIFGERDGKQVPTVAGAELISTTRTIAGRSRKGRSLPPPTANLQIPAVRLGAPAFWPPEPA